MFVCVNATLHGEVSVFNIVSVILSIADRAKKTEGDIVKQYHIQYTNTGNKEMNAEDQRDSCLTMFILAVFQ
jgi:hypothetical protein